MKMMFSVVKNRTKRENKRIKIKQRTNNTDLSWFSANIWNLHPVQKLQNLLCKQDVFLLLKPKFSQDFLFSSHSNPKQNNLFSLLGSRFLSLKQKKLSLMFTLQKSFIYKTCRNNNSRNQLK